MSYIVAQTKEGMDWSLDWEWLMVYLPTALAAVLVLLAGWIIALVVSYLTKALLKRTKLDDKLAHSLAEEQKKPPDLSRGIS